MAWARRRGGLLVEDDYDGELRYDRQPVGALQALAPDRVAYGGTASKTLAPGLRLGWLVVPPRLIDAISSLRAAEDVHVPAPDQIALLPAAALGRRTSATCAACAPATARGATAWSRCSRERAPALVPVGISAGPRRAARAPRRRAELGAD